MIHPDNIRIIDLYIKEAYRANEPIQDFAWGEEEEHNKKLQAEICKHVFLTYKGVKVENLGWGMRVKNINNLDQHV